MATSTNKDYMRNFIFGVVAAFTFSLVVAQTTGTKINRIQLDVAVPEWSEEIVTKNASGVFQLSKVYNFAMVHVNGQKLIKNKDYTITGQTLTLVYLSNLTDAVVEVSGY